MRLLAVAAIVAAVVYWVATDADGDYYERLIRGDRA